MCLEKKIIGESDTRVEITDKKYHKSDYLLNGLYDAWRNRQRTPKTRLGLSYSRE